MTERFLLYSRVSSVTGPKIADFLGIPSGRSAPEERLDHLIRWGSSSSVRYRPDNVVNQRSAISNNVDKFGSLRRMDDAGVPVPNFSRSPRDIGYPAFGRGSSHEGGTDIVVVENDLQARQSGSDYFTEYIQSQSEFRVHVVDGTIEKLSEKIAREVSEEDGRHPVIRNYDNGWRFLRPQSGRPAGVVQAIAAVRAMELDFGAVDMIFDEENNPYVLEVNTAPSADPPTIQTYGEALADMTNLDDYPGMDNVDTEDDDEEDDGSSMDRARSLFSN